MSPTPSFKPSQDPSRVLTEVVEKLSVATSLPMITRAVAEAARHLSGADGTTFVLCEEDKCYYADEDAISPLWKGKRFPQVSCISGWCMQNREVVLIRDIYQDARVPHDAYRPTFVKSLCLVPIREEKPLGAIGTYWAEAYTPTEPQIKFLRVLANSCAVALENLDLKTAVIKQSEEWESMVSRQKDLEMAIHSLVHDLKSPLATMMGFTELLQMQAKNLDERSHRYVESILTTGERVRMQLDRMLMLYKLTNRSMEKQKVDISGLVGQIASQLQVQDPRRQAEFDIEEGHQVFGDPYLLNLALENLLSNAFKYTSKKPTAKIEFKKHDQNPYMTTFMIKDNGDGFDSSKAHELFRPLVRLHSSSEFPGTGLGLASVARIIHMHGGTVRAEGRKSEGAAFFFQLPIIF